MSDPQSSLRRRWSVALIFAFLLVMVMGPGPGVLLINPGEDDPTPGTIFGMPAVYAWGLIWFAAQVVIVVLAYLKVWRHDGD